jgi:hypothetical protein
MGAHFLEGLFQMLKAALHLHKGLLQRFPRLWELLGSKQGGYLPKQALKDLANERQVFALGPFR